MILTMRKQGVKIKEICNLTGLCERSVLANLTGEKQNFKFNVSLSIMAYNREEAMALLKKRLKRDYIDYVEYLKKLTK